MKKTTPSNNRVRMNHYSAWKYVVLIAALLLMALSAIPTWYGEKPAIQLIYSASNGYSAENSEVQTKTTPHSLAELNGYLAHNQITPLKLTEHDGKFEIMFENEADQSKAHHLLTDTLKQGDSLTFSYVSNAPQWLTKMGLEPIKLGLDLRGGVQFLLDVDIDQAFLEKREAISDEVRDMLREERLRGIQITNASDNAIIISSYSKQTDVRDEALNKVTQFVKGNYGDWQIQRKDNSLTIKPTQESIAEFQKVTVNQNIKIMRDRIEELGITEAMVQRQGSNNIRIELPGVQDPAQAKKVIGATSSLAFHKAKSVSDASSRSDLVLKDNENQTVRLEKRAVLTGEHIINARASFDEMGRAEVDISLDHAGGKLMSDFSAKNIGKPMATVYQEYSTNNRGETVKNERVISVATIQSQLGTQFRITGAGTMDEAQDLALLLRAGSLTAPVTIVEERTIGASLGEENIKNGFAALALGMGLTLTFMALWYRRLGWVANVALLFNMVSLLGLISLLPGAVLTLPGIAGLVLTVGMAVDTNVLIFERIRDKMAEGRNFAQSIDIGFRSAFATILDANITTMITAVVLYSMGNGPIQGFALTLGLGLLTSMFTGVFASRAIINLIWGRDARRGLKI